MIELNAADVVEEEEVIEVIDSSATLAASVRRGRRGHRALLCRRYSMESVAAQ